MRFSAISISFFALWCFLFLACEKNNEEDLYGLNGVEDGDTTISFASQILPIFENNCATVGCHNEDAAMAQFVFEDYDRIKANFENHAELIFTSLRHESGAVAMPPSGQLPERQINLIQAWYDAGMPEND